MAEDPRHPWGSGATTHRYTAEVSKVVQRVEREFPRLEANSYICHPWCGWSRLSVDFWDRGGRGDPIPEQLGWRLLEFLRNLSGPPRIRHTIFQHQLWTSWGGSSYWRRDDHTGALRHVHVTYWPE